MTNTITIRQKKAKNLIKPYIDLLRKVLSGQRKQEACDWWLLHIEKKADQHLSSCGYQLDALPSNYVDEKPDDLAAVAKNIRILKSVMSGSPELAMFVEQTTREVFLFYSFFFNMSSFLKESPYFCSSFFLQYIHKTQN